MVAMEGILNVLKPPGMTSHDVVNRVRRLAGLKKVGHAGTLDPEASGVLVVLLGRATRLSQFLTAADKEYRAEAVFGVETETQDVFGQVLRYTDASHLTPDEVLGVLPGFRGQITQVPPSVSAVHYQGRRLYELARAGQRVEVAPRTVQVHALELLGGEWGVKNPRAFFRVSCSKGTYIRTLLADVGKVLGVGACLGFLLRTRAGRFTVAEAHTLEELAALEAGGRLAEAVIPARELFRDLPAVAVKPSAVKTVRSGGRLYPAGAAADTGAFAPGVLVRLVHGEEFLAVARAEAADGRVVFQPVWVPGERV